MEHEAPKTGQLIITSAVEGEPIEEAELICITGPPVLMAIVQAGVFALGIDVESVQTGSGGIITDTIEL